MAPRRRRHAPFAAALGDRWTHTRPECSAGESPRLRAGSVGSGSARQRRVMLVDDDAALRMLYRFNLEASGMQVVEVPDGEQALDALRGDLPDVVLLDVMMPGIDGWTVAERLVADARTRRLPVIFITARADDAAEARGRGLGAAGYLVKPFNPVKLADEIERILAGWTADGRPR